jgi:hypothetical protein
LLLDPAVLVLWSFVDPLLALAAAALEAGDCAVVELAWAALAEDAFERMLKALDREARAVVAWNVAPGWERLDLCEWLARTAITRAARALPPGCRLMRPLISESICDPAPIGPGG